jgi:hypothetical protein
VKGMDDLREVVLKINQVDLQVQVLRTLQEKKLSSSELQTLVEQLGGDHELLLPILKRTNLLKIQKIENSRQYWYSVANHNGHDKEEKPLKVVLPNDKSVQVDRKEIKRTRNKTSDTRL